MKTIATITTAAFLLSGAAALAAPAERAGPINESAVTSDSVYQVATEPRPSVMPVSQRRSAEPEPINPEFEARDAIHAVPEAGVRDQATAEALAAGEPLGPKYQAQEQVRQSIYDVNAGKHGNISEYQ